MGAKDPASTPDIAPDTKPAPILGRIELAICVLAQTKRNPLGIVFKSIGKQLSLFFFELILKEEYNI